MAGRPPKESIDYAGWDVNIFDSDPKIDKLMDAQGCVGFAIYFYLCQRAYGSHGYYYPWCYDDSATTARKIGGGAGANSVEETVKLCFRVGLLNEELYDRWKILTSRGIQKRYAQVASSRTNKSVISEYWLLTDEESRGLVKSTINNEGTPIMTPDNSIMHPHNTHFSDRKVKESKGKKSKGESVSAPALFKPYGEYGNVLLTKEQFSALKTEFPKDYAARIDRLGEYMESAGKVYKNHLATIRKWAREDAKGSPSSPKGNGTGRPAKEVAAHRYDQREYSDEDLAGLQMDLGKEDGTKE